MKIPKSLISFTPQELNALRLSANIADNMLVKNDPKKGMPKMPKSPHNPFLK
jgi:hypothetical protein